MAAWHPKHARTTTVGFWNIGTAANAAHRYSEWYAAHLLIFTRQSESGHWTIHVVYHRLSIFGLEALKIGSSSPLTQSVSRRIHLCLYCSFWIEMLEATSTVAPQKPNLTQQFLRISRISSKPRSQTLLKSSNNTAQSFAQNLGHHFHRGNPRIEIKSFM